MTTRIEVGVLGATGTVGGRLVDLLQNHPWFRIAELSASPKAAGHRFGDVGSEAAEALPESIRALSLQDPYAGWSSPLLLSALPSAVAGDLESELAHRGHIVVSNASSHRLDDDVPLIIPEINPDHLALVERQAERWPGAIVTNPNCSVVGLTLALAPLHERFRIETVMVTTLQSLSGAGRRGVSALDAVDNVIPYIAGEEEKLSQEPRKILGALGEGRIVPADFRLSAQTHRVPVRYGHTLAVALKLSERASVDQVVEVLSKFTGPALDERLPSAPPRPLEVLDEEARPQPRLDRDRAGGMTVSVGRVRRCEVLDIKFTVLVHNLVRGAAGAALLNAELCQVCGLNAAALARLQ